MKNKDKWVPSKYVYRNNKLSSSKNSKELRVGSRLIADIVADLYDTYIPKYVKGKLIDLGCGKVPLFEAYKNYVTENICVDWISTSKDGYLDFECDLNKGLPFDDGYFDTIILSDVLEHIPQPDEFWFEMSRILASNGKVFINTPFYYCLHEAPHDYYRYTEYALRRFAEYANFKILLIKPIGGTIEILADIFAKHLQFVPLIGEVLSSVIQWAAFAFIKTSLGKKISEKTSKVFPLGYFMVAEKIG
jgi:2-polyprenyl-3-methyl-5-hydroxy-6-metoxy-1,4-benzoquinol methylase